MAPTQLGMATSSSEVTLSTMNPGFVQGEGVNNNSFPAGLRVLVVDDDPICLLILDRMLRRCLYKVTTCGRAIEALNILRENKDGFDLVISDVYMPDMDGFKLLELVGLEMDLPVIMMSTNGETSAVMKGIEHGACNYLLKPVRIEELKNIWQHVVRRQKKDTELAGNFEDRLLDNFGDHQASAIDGPDGASKQSKKRKDVKEEEEDTEQDNEDPSSMKKPRVVWSVELHQQFVNAVNQLGIDKAVPKRILELMDVRGLTRENVASHLQKYRLYLKRISGVAHQAGGLGPMFGELHEATFGGVLGDLRAQLSPEVLVSTLQAGLLGRLGSNNSEPGSVNQSLLQIAAINAGNSGALVRSSYGQSSMNTSGNLHPSISSGIDLKNVSNRPQQIAPFGQPEKGAARLPALQQYVASVSSGEVGQLVGLNNHLPTKTRCNSLRLQTLQQQASSQMGCGTTLDTSTGRQQILSGEIGAEILNVDSFNNGLSTGVGSHFRPGQESSSSISFTSSNGLGSYRRNVGMGIQNLNLSPAGNVNNDFPSSVSSLSTSCGNDGRIITRNKGFVFNAGDISPWSMGGAISNPVVLSGSNPASGLHTGLNNWHSWQSLGLSQELGQTTSSVLSPLCNQESSGQAMKVGCTQEQGSGQASKFQDSAIVNTGHFRPLVTTAPQNEQFTGESGLNFKEDPFELPLGSKAERGIMPEPFSSPDDLMTTYFKQQQQEMMGFSEGDFVAEGYALGNMYVK